MRNQGNDEPAIGENPVWLEMTPVVRVLLEMSEEDAMWFRHQINLRKAQTKRTGSADLGTLPPGVWVGDAKNPIDGKYLDISIREILLFG